MAGCEHFSACEGRIDALSKRVDGIENRVEGLDERSRKQGEDLAALRAQVMTWAGLGALVGGGIVSVVANMLSK
jgi:hypothetical protein